MPAEIRMNIETFTVLVDGAILVAYRVEGFADWRFFIIDAEELD